MTTVKLLHPSGTSIIIWNAICKGIKDGREIETKLGIAPAGGDTEADVKLLVNGVEVPLIETLQEMLGQYTAQVKKDASEQVLELAQGAGLSDLIQTLQSSEWMIKEALIKFEMTQG